MKSKYYPHVTILAAAALVIGPLCFVLTLWHLRNEPISDNGAVFADVDDASSALLNTQVVAVEFPSTQSVASITAATQDGTAEPRDVVAMTKATTETAIVDTASATTESTRVAMLPAHNLTTIPDVPQRSANEAMSDTIAPTIRDTDAVLDMATIQEESIDLSANSASDRVPVPSIAAQTGTAPMPSAPVVARSLQHNTRDKEPIAPDPHATPEYAASQVKPPSYFGATGHLSMAGGTLGVIAGTTPPSGVTSGSRRSSTNARTSGRHASKRRSTSRSSRSETSETKKDGTQQDKRPIQGFDSPWVLPGDGFGSQPQVKIVDVILQQPLESRRVSRMENVVAVSREQGWPIALVKSDLPDDHWWVQQMVGVRGNAFAARVNFGNEYSISGSVYHMVIVFLDSPDEVRRFRIAKQFDELPEGVRHSREFTFVRK